MAIISGDFNELKEVLGPHGYTPDSLLCYKVCVLCVWMMRNVSLDRDRERERDRER